MATVIDSLLIQLGFDPDSGGANVFENSLDGIIKKTDKFNSDMAGLRNGALAAGAVIGAAMYKAANAAMEFESAMADVKKVVDFDTPEGLVNMREELLELSTQIPITAEGFAQIAAAAGQSGIAADEITVFAEAAAKMGTAFDISAEQAGQSMAEMRVAFKMSQEEVGGLVDQINYLGDSTPNSAAKILQIVQRIGPLGEIAGVSAEQIAAMGASITALEPEIVSTGLKNMMINLTKGSAATKGQIGAFAELGMTTEAVALGMQEDSEAMINTVLNAIKGAKPEEQAALINTIFGAEALPVVAQLISNGEMLEKNLSAIGDASLYAGSAQKEFETRSATTANQIELLKNNLNVAAITVGDILLPAIGRVVEAVTPLVQQFAAWAKENPELITQMLMIAGAIIGVILAITGIGLAVSAFLSALTGLGAILGVIGAGLSFILGPIGLIILAIGAIIGLLVLIYMNWEQIAAGMVAEWERIKAAFSAAVAAISAWWSGLMASLSAAFSAYVAYLQSAMANIVAAFSAVVGAIFGVWSGLWSGVKSMAGAAIDWIIGKVQSLVGMITGAIGKVKELASYSPSELGGKAASWAAGKLGFGGGGNKTSNVNQTFNVSSAKDASNIAKNSTGGTRSRNTGVKQ